MESSKYKGTDNEVGVSDGARLLSIIERLSEKNGSKFSSNSKETASNQENKSMIAIDLNSKYDVNIPTRKSGKGSKEKLSKISTQTKPGNTDGNTTSQVIAKPPYNGTATVTRQKEETLSHLKCLKRNDNPSRPEIPEMPNNIKLTIKIEKTSAAKPSLLCLCKPSTPCADLTKQNKTEQNIKTNLPKDNLLRDDIAEGFDMDTNYGANNCDINRRSHVRPQHSFPENTSLTENACLDENNLSGNASLQPRRPGTRECACVCGICLQEFSSALLLDRHQKQSGHYLCSGCGEAFSDMMLLERHVKEDQCKVFLCFICLRKFLSEENLDLHKIKEHFMCIHCKKCYINGESLLKHQGSCSGSGHRRRYTCLKCSRTFISRSRYKTHMMSSHTGERPFVCSQCGKGFSRMYALNTHVTYTHSSEKKFQCEFCFKSFKRKDHMKSHVVIHSKEKPFSCDFCGKGFNQKVSLKRHLPCSFAEHYKLLEKRNLTSQSLSTSGITSAEDGGVGRVEATQGSLSCNCPDSCRCKAFTLGVNVQSQNTEGGDQELGVLSCCCDIDIKTIMSPIAKGKAAEKSENVEENEK